jgi:hypothetical protein
MLSIAQKKIPTKEKKNTKAVRTSDVCQSQNIKISTSFLDITYCLHPFLPERYFVYQS